MIELELKEALILYASVLGGVIAFVWLYTEFAVRRPQRHLGKQFLWRCTFCGFTYLDESSDRISECPQCSSLNAADDKGAREVPAPRDALEDASTAQTGEAPRKNPSRRRRPTQRRRGPRRR